MESEILNDSSPSGDREEKCADVKERLTLHVQKRLSGEKNSPKDSDAGTCEPGVSASYKSLLPRKKTRRIKRKSFSSKQNKKRMKSVKFGKQAKFSRQSVLASSQDQNGDEIPDATSQIHQGNIRGESFFNNSILDEILSEKKKALLESEEVLELLKKYFPT